MLAKIAEILDSIYIEPWRAILKEPPLTLRSWGLLFFIVMVYSLTIAVIFDLFPRLLGSN